jgi:bifunctional non-homologous end joining protein LigD
MLWRVSSPRLYPAGFIEPCLPTVRSKPPSGPEWIHEVKADGYRLMVRREGKRVRLFTRRGHDWTRRFGELAEAINSIPRISSLTIDGEACVCGSDGVPVFALLHSGSYDSAVVLYAFDLLELNGTDLRTEPLKRRKAKLAKLLEKADPSRLGYTDHAEEDGAAIFRHACKLGLEGIVSKRRDFPYRSGRCKAWVKVKNPTSPAMMRIDDRTF